MMERLTLSFALLLLAAGAAYPPSKLQRVPLQKKRLIFESPIKYEKRILRYDEKTGQPIYYDPKPRVQLLDAKSGKYAFKWIGYDGKEKTIIFQRADAIDTIVSASVSKTASGQYLYTYNIKNLPSSGTYLSGFAVQTFAPSVKPIPINNGYVGKMSKNKEMWEGNWIYFGSSNFKDPILPGQSIELKLLSPTPPGLVECRVHGGELGYKGVGEDMPQELENVLPSYEDWPKGYTIGPYENLKPMTREGRIHEILALLPQFRHLGWITPMALEWYERNLRRSAVEEIRKKAERDLEAGSITTEVYAIIHAVSQ